MSLTREKLPNKFLSSFWYCTNDKTKMIPVSNRYASNPNFVIRKNNIETGLNNAAAMRKIESDSIKEITDMLTQIYDLDQELDDLPLVGVYCPTCEKSSASPRINEVENLGKNIGKSLFEQHRVMDTKDHGRFRFVDHFGLSRQKEDGSKDNSRMIFYGIFWGITVLLLFYVVGLEMKFKSRWIPLGPFLIVVGIIIVATTGVSISSGRFGRSF